MLTDSFGQENSTFVDFATLWGGLEDPAGGESFVADADQRSARQNVLWRVRWFEGVTPKMRLLNATQVFEILDVATVGRKEALLLTCKAFEVKPLKG